MAGYDWHIAKPVDPYELLGAIVRVRKPDAVGATIRIAQRSHACGS